MRRYHCVSFFLVTGRVAALAQAGDHLLVGEHGLVVRAPVDRAVLAVGQPALEHLQEEPLVPAVVLRVAGVEHAVPVERAGVAAHRRLLLLDVLVRPADRVLAALDGGVLGGQAEGVPADRVHDVEAALHPVARDDVAERVRLGVAHVQVARGVREHVEDVLLGPVVVGAARAERRELVPDRQPPLLDRRDVVGVADVVRFGHRSQLLISRGVGQPPQPTEVRRSPYGQREVTHDGARAPGRCSCSPCRSSRSCRRARPRPASARRSRAEPAATGSIRPRGRVFGWNPASRSRAPETPANDGNRAAWSSTRSDPASPVIVPAEKVRQRGSAGVVGRRRRGGLGSGSRCRRRVGEGPLRQRPRLAGVGDADVDLDGLRGRRHDERDGRLVDDLGVVEDHVADTDDGIGPEPGARDRHLRAAVDRSLGAA